MRSKKVVHFEEEIPTQFVQPSEIVHCLKPFLTLSKVFGIPTFQILGNLVTKSTLFSALSLWNIFLLCNQVFLLAIKLYKGEDFARKSGPEIILRFHLISIHLWSFAYSTSMSRLLKESSTIENRLKIYKIDGYNCYLSRKCLALTIIYVCLSTILALKSFLIELVVNYSSFLKSFDKYSELNCGSESTIFYHPTISSLHCLGSTIASCFIWTFGDFLLLLLSIILGELVSRLNRGIKTMEPGRFTSIEIDIVREHHGLVAKLISKFDDAMSVLNLLNLVFNSAYLLVGSYSLLLIRINKDKKALVGAINLLCQVGIVAFKTLIGLVGAALLHFKAHEAISDVRSWPVAREFQDFSINNGRATVIHAFLAQLSGPNIGLTIGKIMVITGKLVVLVSLGISGFVAFSRIILSSCSSRARF